MGNFRAHFAGFGGRRVASNGPVFQTMAVKIRLKRIGAKNDPAYRIVVTDSRSPRDGRFIEELGTYLPTRKDQKIKLDLERARYWKANGAQPTETVAGIIRSAIKAEAAAAAA